MDLLLIVALGLVAGAAVPLFPGPTLAAALAVAVLLRRRRVAVLLLAVALALGAARSRGALRAHEADRTRTNAELPRLARCAGTATVRSSPVRQHGTLRWDGAARDLDCGGGERWAGTAAFYGGPPDLARGDEVELVAQLAAPERLWNVETGDVRPREARRAILRSGGALDVRITRSGRGLWAWIDRARAHVRRRIDATFVGPSAAMARALVLGETDLDDEDDEAFRASGLSHLLAVSGMHLVLVVVGFVRVVRAVLVRVERWAACFDMGRVAAAVGIPIAWIYADFAGGSGSALRAAWMLTASLAATAAGRASDGPRAFALSVAAMALADPLVLFDVSFLLSACATAGLLVLARPLGERLTARLPARLHVLARSLATTVAATIPCAPVLATMTSGLPLGGTLANLVAVPLGEAAALPLCLLHAVLSPLPAAEQGTATVASGALWLVRAIARASASLRVLQVPLPAPSPWQLAVLTAGTVAILMTRRHRRGGAALCTAALLVLLELHVRAEGAPRGRLRATFFDVGQGDSALVDLPDGSAMLIDGGGLVGSPTDVGTRVLAPALRMRRRTALDVVVLSHPHPDHFGGLDKGLGAVRVGAFWDTGQGEREGMGGTYAAVLARMRALGTPILRPEALCGHRALGGAEIDLLAPCPRPSVDRGPNDNSFVLRVRFGARAFLFVGDAEHEEEGDLLQNARDRLRADVLKVGHHGSRTSTSPAFLAAVRPSLAVLSTGVRNRFGHPHPVTVGTLGAAGVRALRTDEMGEIVVETDGEGLSVRTASVDGAPRSL